MSEEIAQARADLLLARDWQRRAEQLEAELEQANAREVQLRHEIARLKADAAAAVLVFRWIVSFSDAAMQAARTLHYDMRGKAQQYLALASPGDELVREREQLYTLLAMAQADVCSLHCPSVWKTAERPPHSERCRAISDMLLRHAAEGLRDGGWELF